MKLLIGFLAVWAVASWAYNLHQFLLPDFFGVARFLLSDIGSGDLPFHVAVTFGRVIMGVAGAALIGIPLGVGLARNERLRKELLPSIEFLRGIPTSMLFPLFIIFFGVDELSKAMISLYLAAPIFTINTMIGVMPRQENQGRRDYLRLHKRRIPMREQVFAIMWDGLPSIASSFKLSVSLGLVVVIVTEMFFVSSSGVGWASFRAYQNLNLDKMYLYILVVGMIASLANTGLDRIIEWVRVRSGDVTNLE